MSVGFQIFKSSQGWKLQTDNQIDLANWDIDYRRDSIYCRPRGVNFLYMVFGTVFFLGLAVCFIWLAIPGLRLNDYSSQSLEPKSFPAITNVVLTTRQNRSRYQQEMPTQEDIQRSTDRLKESIMRDMTPEERAEFERELQEDRLASQRRSAESNSKIETVARIMETVGRIFAGLGALFCGFVGGVLCLPRALLFFRNQMEIKVHGNELTFVRPKVFGGFKTKQVPLSHLAGIRVHAVRRIRRRPAPSCVVWIVDISSRNRDVFPIRFEVEQLNVGGSLTSPPHRVEHFADNLQRLTRLPSIR